MNWFSLIWINDDRLLQWIALWKFSIENHNNQRHCRQYILSRVSEANGNPRHFNCIYLIHFCWNIFLHDIVTGFQPLSDGNVTNDRRKFYSNFIIQLFLLSLFDGVVDRFNSACEWLESQVYGHQRFGWSFFKQSKKARKTSRKYSNWCSRAQKKKITNKKFKLNFRWKFFHLFSSSLSHTNTHTFCSTF